jgi:hypothetical protein
MDEMGDGEQDHIPGLKFSGFRLHGDKGKKE